VYLGYEQYRVFRLARQVHRLFVERRFDEARGPLSQWLAARPGSGAAYYYRAWAALVSDDPAQVVAATDQARRLGYDPHLLDCLAAIYHSRANRINVAETILERAFREDIEPRAEVAKELARIYLSTYRLAPAAEAIKRWRSLAPEDPQPYMWSNEICSRSDAEPALMIQNYRAALKRNPQLAKAQLGLADQLTKARCFEEAGEMYRAILDRHPNDAQALVGLGRGALEQGDLADSLRQFEAALKVDPRRPDALQEAARVDLRLGRLREARTRLELLTQIEPHDFKTRYAYAQVLRMTGDEAGARLHNERAARLREENDQVVQLVSTLRKNPEDLRSRFTVAKWMLEHGHDKEGLKWTAEILRAAPHHSATHALLADYYSSHGNSGTANYHRLQAASQENAESTHHTPVLDR
jgi:tetratricopeptide (TPR) repeat protein